MDENKFWSIIEEYNGINFTQILLKRLSTLDEILEFDLIFKQHLEALYIFPIMEATFIINSYISDDEFKYFRSWLISKGEEKFKMALENIESISLWLNLNEIDSILDLGEDVFDGILDAYLSLGGDENYFYSNTYIENDIDIEMNWAENFTEYQSRYPILVNKYWNQDKIEELH